MEPGISVTQIDVDTEDRFVTLRRALGVTTFGLNLIILRPGQRGRIHRHFQQEEVYIVWDGVLTLVVDGEEQQHARGAVIRVAPELRRQLANRGPADVALIALGGATPHVGRDGEAYEGWDAGEAGRPPQEVPLPGDLEL
jgi:uncharacterized cupin superfamily protein